MYVAYAVVLSLGLSACNAVYGLSEPQLHGLATRTITFDNSGSRSDLVDFQVAIRLDAGKIDYPTIVDPTVDMRFEDAATHADLPFDVDTWNPDGESLVWVRLPIVHARSTTDAIILHAGADANGHADALATWAGSELVMHGNADYANAAGSAFAGVADGIVAYAGVAGGAYGMTGAGTHSITLAHSDQLLAGWSAFTLELWLYADYDDRHLGGASDCMPSGAGGKPACPEPGVFEKQGVFSNGRLIGVDFDGFARIQLDLVFSDSTSFNTSGLIPLQAWTYLAWAFDGDVLVLYRDGLPYDLETHTAPMGSSSFPVHLASNGLRGGLDEVRISHAYHDTNWIDAQYRSITGRFAVFGAAE